MLNRLFIAIGVLVILAIGAAFIVPRFIQWGDYRVRLEQMASGAFGTEVAITGDINLSLLPQPKIEFDDVRVGPEAAPVLQVAKVEAEFSLLDFLRDQYKVTRLEVRQPTVNLAIGADGTFSSGIALTPTAGQSNVSIANADIVGGIVRLTDARAATTYEATSIEGRLTLDSLSGPFSFSGTGNADGAGYSVRVSSTVPGTDGSTGLSVFLRAADDSFTLETSGALQSGAAPKYSGDLTYRRPPPAQQNDAAADIGRGDFVITGRLDSTPERTLLSNYTLTPDENRSTTRLTGAVEVNTGADMAFSAVLSGGVFALPPRDATKELTDPPYELVRLLGEIPLPPIPSIPGRIGVDITEADLRAVSLRNVRLDAVTDGNSWQITSATATLPGESTLTLNGNLNTVDGKPIFAGHATLDSQRLDLLAQLWRKAPAGNPLFNLSGSLSSDVALSSDTLTLSTGTLVVADINQAFEASIGFGSQRTLKVEAHFTTLGEAESSALAALLPDVTGNGSFGATFPTGQMNLSVSRAVLFGLTGTDLAANVSWAGGVLEFSRLAAADFGGASFDAKATGFGTLAKPELSGSGHVRISDNAPIVGQLLTSLSTPQYVQDFLRRSLPADLDLQLNAPAGDGGQTLTASGKLGTAETKVEAKLGAGIVSALTAPITVSLDMQSESPSLMTMQLGLGSEAPFDDRTPLRLMASISGAPSSSYDTHVVLSSGQDHINYDGSVVPGDFTRISGTGALDAAIGDPSGLVDVLGMGGVYLPAVTGKAQLAFDGADDIKVTEINAGGVTGDLALARRNGTASVTGSLALPTMDARALLPMLAGPTGTIADGGVWSSGPFDIGAAARTTEGRIDVAVASVTAGGKPLLTDTNFGLDWNATGLHLRNLSGRIGNGTLSFDATVCCSSATLPAKQIAGRIALDTVPLDAIAPEPIAAGLDGAVDAAAQFDGTGDSLAAAIAAMTGSGSYTINGFSAARFDPAIFTSAATLTGLFEIEPAALTTAITEKLAAAPFIAPTVTGTFTIAGGVLRSPNLAIVGAGARVFGGATLDLKDLGLDARYAMTPTGVVDATKIDSTTAEVDAVVTGPLWAPAGRYDVSALVDGMKIKANEIELARLEQLRAEDEARQRAAAEERARVAAAEAARIAAEEEAARRASAEQAAREASASAEASRQASAADAAAAADAEAARGAELAAQETARPTSTTTPSSSSSSSIPPPMDLGL